MIKGKKSGGIYFLTDIAVPNKDSITLLTGERPHTFDEITTLSDKMELSVNLSVLQIRVVVSLYYDSQDASLNHPNARAGVEEMTKTHHEKNIRHFEDKQLNSVQKQTLFSFNLTTIKTE